MKQFIITPASGKRLIGRALASHPTVLAALEFGTIVIVAGTTNGYVAEEILTRIGQVEGFTRKRFFRGVILPPSIPMTETGRLPDETGFPGDVIIVNGRWHKGKTIFDVVDNLKEGDIILKGANALDLAHRQAAIYIGHPKAGTIGAALQAVAGRRVRLILPVGLEKRIRRSDGPGIPVEYPGSTRTAIVARTRASIHGNRSYFTVSGCHCRTRRGWRSLRSRGLRLACCQRRDKADERRRSASEVSCFRAGV
ncbi:MAG: hypothetical protein AB1510_11755 [Bacillota bacterium]